MIVYPKVRDAGVRRHESATEDTKVDVILGILVMEMDCLFFDLDLDAHLLAQLASQRFLVRFARLNPPTGKLPEQRKRSSSGALGYQVLSPILLNHCSDHANMTPAHETCT